MYQSPGPEMMNERRPSSAEAMKSYTIARGFGGVRGGGSYGFSDGPTAVADREDAPSVLSI